jgi:hypothetical protein
MSFFFEPVAKPNQFPGDGNRIEAVPRLGRIVGLLMVAFLALIIVSFGGCAATKAYHRAQKRADARNDVSVTAIRIRVAQQQARIVRAQNAAVKQRAEQRFLEAVGIRRAQDEISKTLTPIYVQHEAIQAQERIATSGRNNTVIYVPAGTNGTPTITQTGKANP